MSLKKPSSYRALDVVEYDYSGGTVIDGCPDWAFAIGVIAAAGVVTLCGVGIYKSCTASAAPAAPRTHHHHSHINNVFSDKKRAALDKWVSKGGMYSYDRGGAWVWKPGFEDDARFLRFDAYMSPR